MEAWKKEEQVVLNTDEPITKKRLITDFRKLGLESGDVVITHTEMSKIGWVVGDAPAVIDALMETVTENGTIVMPAHSTGNTEPRNWNYPAVPESWWAIIREEMPPFRPEITSTRGLGRLPELFRTYPGVLRSKHPQNSFTAWGKLAKTVVADHDLDHTFGHRSHLGKLYELDGKILLIGVPHENNTSLHYAEYKADSPVTTKSMTGAALLENGVRVWRTWEELDHNAADFNQLGTAYEASIQYQPRKIGQAESRLTPMKDIVDFAVDWMIANRESSD